MTTPFLLHDLVFASAARRPQAPALVAGRNTLDYGEPASRVQTFAAGLCKLGLARGERVGIYLDKRPETVVAAFGAAAAGGVFVPLNPLLKPAQVAYILRDCNVRVLVTSPERLALSPRARAMCRISSTCPARDAAGDSYRACAASHWPTSPATRRRARTASSTPTCRRSSTRPAAPASPRASCCPIATWWPGRRASRRISATQRRHAARCAAAVVRCRLQPAHDRIPCRRARRADQLPAAARRAQRRAKERVTGLTAVPPLWIQLSQLDWPPQIRRAPALLRQYRRPHAAGDAEALRAKLPSTRPFLMYGLTEAFRSTYLPPEEVDRRPDSIGKAIPNAEILVLRADGTPCAPDEPGELVHRGALVGMGYWNDRREDRRALQAAARPRRGARAAGDRRVLGRHRADGCGGISLLRRPARRDDQDLGLPRQPDRDRGGVLWHAAGRRGRRVRRAAPDARPGDRRDRRSARAARSTRRRCSPSAGSACPPTWCRR